MLIGTEATTFIADWEKNGLREEKIKEFYGSVRKYFMCTLDYLIKKLPFEDKVLSSAEIADVSSKEEFKQSSLIYLLDRFPVLLPPDCSKDTLLEEYNLFLATNTTCCVAERIGDTWTAIGQMTDSCGSVLFAKLGAFMKGLLTIPLAHLALCTVGLTLRASNTIWECKILKTTHQNTKWPFSG